MLGTPLVLWLLASLPKEDQPLDFSLAWDNLCEEHQQEALDGAVRLGLADGEADWTDAGWAAAEQLGRLVREST